MSRQNLLNKLEMDILPVLCTNYSVNIARTDTVTKLPQSSIDNALQFVKDLVIQTKHFAITFDIEKLENSYCRFSVLDTTSFYGRSQIYLESVILTQDGHDMPVKSMHLMADEIVAVYLVEHLLDDIDADDDFYIRRPTTF